MLAEHFVIGNEWTEIAPSQTLTPDKDKQFLVLSVDQPLLVDVSSGAFTSPNGDVLRPELKLIDESENEHSLVFDGALGNSSAIYKDRGSQQPRPTYTRVLIRSEKPMKIAKLTWMTYYREDIK
jgi:hypothetical protein